MSALATRDRPRVAHERQRRNLAAHAVDDGPTLEDSILRAWEGLIVDGRAACPVCGGAMTPGARSAQGGACAGCGSQLT